MFLIHAPQQQQRQEEVAQVVDLEGHLKPVLAHAQRRALLEPRVEHQRADRRQRALRDARVDLRRGGADAFQGGEVERDDLARVRGGGGGVAAAVQQSVQGRGGGGVGVEFRAAVRRNSSPLPGR